MCLMAFNWKRFLTWVIAVLFLIALIWGAVQVFSEKPSPTQLMIDAITLRTTNDTISKAQVITEMDRQVKMIDSQGITTQWDLLRICIAAGSCSQDDYFDFLLMIAVEKQDEVPNAPIIVNAITANRYWGNSEKILDFSKSLADANQQVDELGIRAIKNKWQEVIQCDGKCADFHSLFFDFIRLLLSV